MHEEDNLSFDLIDFLSIISIFFLAVLFATIPAYLYSRLASYAFVSFDAIKYPIALISFFLAYKLFGLFPKVYYYSGMISTLIVGSAPALTYISTKSSSIEEISIGLCYSIVLWVIGYTVTKAGYTHLKEG